MNSMQFTTTQQKAYELEINAIVITQQKIQNLFLIKKTNKEKLKYYKNLLLMIRKIYIIHMF